MSDRRNDGDSSIPSAVGLCWTEEITFTIYLIFMVPATSTNGHGENAGLLALLPLAIRGGNGGVTKKIKTVTPWRLQTTEHCPFYFASSLELLPNRKGNLRQVF